MKRGSTHLKTVNATSVIISYMAEITTSGGMNMENTTAYATRAMMRRVRMQKRLASVWVAELMI